MDPDTEQLIEALKQPEVWPGEVERVECVETHISWVFLTGDAAYKIRKPVDLGFLDFSTLVKRDHCAHEEVRLNRRFAPELYLDVVRISGTPRRPVVCGAGKPLEVAVRMRQFDQSKQLDRELEAGRLMPEDMIEVAREVAGFQERAPRAELGDSYGTLAHVLDPVRENFSQIRAALGEWGTERDRLANLEAVSERWATDLREVFQARRAGDFIREGHGDLHLANLTRLPEGIRAFDCIEFSADLRWIDVVNDIAFLFMDLGFQSRNDLGWWFVNAWLESSGDYRGLAVLRFYTLYRCMVRAKVAALRSLQQSGAERATSEDNFRAHIKYAQALVAPAAPRVLLTTGLSGSGKSWVASRVAANLGLVHIRSDVERKRLFGLGYDERSGSALNAGIYSENASQMTYARLAALMRGVLECGHGVIIDATMLTRAQRGPLLESARRSGVEAGILHVTAAPAVLRTRIEQRARKSTDPSEANSVVLAAQMKHLEPPAESEGAWLLEVDNSGDLDIPGLIDQIRTR